MRKTRFWVRESVTRGEGINTSQRPSWDATFNEMCKSYMVFQNIYFPKK